MQSVAASFGGGLLDPHDLAALASKESGAGRLLTKSGWGNQHGTAAFGILQFVGRRSADVAGVAAGPYSRAHIEQGATRLHGYLKHASDQFPEWTAWQQRRFAFAQYHHHTATPLRNDNEPEGDVAARATSFGDLLFANDSLSELVYASDVMRRADLLRAWLPSDEFSVVNVTESS